MKVDIDNADTTRKDVDLRGWLTHLQQELLGASNYIENLKQDLKSCSPWVKVEEKTLPEPKELVLLRSIVNGQAYVTIGYRQKMMGNWVWCCEQNGCEFDDDELVTHWRNLPAPGGESNEN